MKYVCMWLSKETDRHSPIDSQNRTYPMMSFCYYYFCCFYCPMVLLLLICFFLHFCCVWNNCQCFCCLFCLLFMFYSAFVCKIPTVNWKSKQLQLQQLLYARYARIKATTIPTEKLLQMQKQLQRLHFCLEYP